LVDLIKLLSVFGLVLLLIRLNWNLGAVMLIGAAALGLLSGMGPLDILDIAFHSAVAKNTVTLIVALALIMVLERVLRDTETLKRLVSSLKGLMGDSRIVMAAMPAIIGILPSPGGAYFSAPLVEESSTGAVIPSERKGFINHWFRHVWEYISPLYPGFIMTAAIAGVSYGKLFVHTFIFPVTVIITGALLGFRGVEAAPAVESSLGRRRDLINAVISFSPILACMLIVLLFGVNIAVAMALVVAAMMAWFRYTPKRILTTLKESLSVKTLLLVLGVFIFKGIMDHSESVKSLPAFFSSAGVPVAVILFVLPFLVGLMAGIVMAYVGIALPMILPLIGGSQ